MSARVEWAGATTTAVTVERQGTELGDDFVDEEAAVVFGGDSLYVIEGSRQELAVLLQRALDALAEDPA